MIKSELRTIYLEKRRAMSDAERAESDTRIADRFLSTFDLASVGSLHCFISAAHLNEVDTRPIFERVWGEFPRVKTYAPRVDHETGEIDAIQYDASSTLKGGKWSIAEPAGNVTVEASEIDIVIVPLLCFDTRGYRVGYGKGFYDKFLSRCRTDCIKVGLSYLPPVEKIDDIDSHDIRLDFCVTPEEIFATEFTENSERKD